MGLYQESKVDVGLCAYPYVKLFASQPRFYAVLHYRVKV